MRKYDAVIAGYLCVDLVPGFRQNESTRSVSDFLRPGKLIEIDGLDYMLGGVVANTGMAMKIFDREVFLQGLVGEDFLGNMVMELLERQGLSTGIQRIKEAGTAFGLVIAPPGVDRIFLESPGCSRLFDLEHINFEQVAQSRLFHFGYPPLLKQFYREGGARLTSLFSSIQSMGVLTSLDFSLPDADSESGKLNWPEILQQVLPFTDIFVPSLEEALQIMLPEVYTAIQAVSGNTELIDLVPLETIRRIGRGIIDSGVKIALIKAGHRGAYLWTGDVSRLDERAGFTLPPARWNHRELWCEAYAADSSRIKNASGAGDTASAAFLSALLCGESPESSLQYATLAGRNNLYCNDMYDELNNWSQMTAEIALGPGKITDLNAPAEHAIHGR